jgi:hypothetical protein
LPPQFYIAPLKETLRLGPGQVAMVPMAFLPRFPLTTAGAEDELPMTDAALAAGAPISRFQQADWDLLWETTPGGSSVGPHRRRNHPPSESPRLPRSPPRYRVSSTVWIATDRGDVHWPLQLTTVQDNAWGLPDVIALFARPEPPSEQEQRIAETLSLFRAVQERERRLASSDAAPPLEPPTATEPTARCQDVWMADAAAHPRRRRSRANATRAPADCYDVSVRNPDPSALLKVTLVALSRPDPGLRLHVLGTAGEDEEEDEDAFDQTGSSYIHHWSNGSIFGDGSLHIPGDGAPHYVVTLCLSSSSPSRPVGASASSQRSFQSPNSVFNAAEAVDSAPIGVPDWWDDGDDNATLGFLQIKTSQDTLLVRLLRREEEDAVRKDEVGRSAAPWSRDIRRLGNTGETTASNSDSTTPAMRVLELHPARLDLNFVMSSLPTVNETLELINVSPHPISIMRLALVLEELPMNVWGKNSVESPSAIEQMGIDLRILHVSDVLSRPIAPGVKVASAISLLCAVDWDRLLQQYAGTFPLTIKGALVVRGTLESNVSYPDWVNAQRLGDRNDSNFVLEMPITINITRGIVGFLVEGSTHAAHSFWTMKFYSDMLDIITHLYFPIQASITMAVVAERDLDRMSPNYVKGVDHQFRVFGDSGIDAVVDEVSIVYEDHMNTTLGSLCHRFDAYVVERGPSELIDLEELVNMGSFHIRYRFPTGEAHQNEKRLGGSDFSNLIYPVVCHVRITTDPSYGVHEIPLIVYSGELSISKSHPDNTTTDESRNWYDVVSEMDSFLEWFRGTKPGHALCSVFTSSTLRNTNNGDTLFLYRYFFGLAETRVNPNDSKLTPILLKIGGIEQGEIETVPFYVTNYNPLPVTIQIAIGEVEGQSISIGRYSISSDGISDGLLVGLSQKHRGIQGSRARSGRLRGHPIDGLRQVLTTDKLSEQYFSRFPFRDDISKSEAAVAKFPFLRKLFNLHSIIGIHTLPEPRRLSPGGWNRCEKSTHPPLYGLFQKKAMSPTQGFSDPFIISSDRKSFRRLDVCWNADGEPEDMKSDGTFVVVPPGGVVRFDVKVRAPLQGSLHKDITQFVATGLVLTSNHGEIMPIVVEFKALQGRLQLSPVPTLVESDTGVVRVPLELFQKTPAVQSAGLRIQPHNTLIHELKMGEVIVPRSARYEQNGVPLFVKSSFLRDVYLRKIVSCNPLFKVDLGNSTTADKSDIFFGVHIGSIRSSIDCQPVHGVPKADSQFPSFYRCALSWLSKQAELQPQQCGFISSFSHSYGCDSVEGNCQKESLDKLIHSVRLALMISEWSDEFYSGGYIENSPRRISPTFAGKSGRRSMDGIVPPIVVDTISEALRHLQSASETGSLTLGTTLRAVVEYNATPDEVSPVRHGTSEFRESGQLISLAIRDISVETLLHVPKLLNVNSSVFEGRGSEHEQILEFHPTYFGHVASISIPLRNPTNVAVRVRLGIDGRRFRLNPNDRSLFQTPYVQIGRKRDDWPRIWASEQWWDHGGAFFLADGDGNVIRSPYNVSIKSGLGALISTMNPSISSNVAFLNGCGTRCGFAPENDYRLPLPVSVAPVSPIGASAVSGSTLAGLGGIFFVNQSGHVLTIDDEKQIDGRNFSVDSGGSFVTGGYGPSAFAIPYAALDEIIIPPFGKAEIGPILFRPTGRTEKLGCSTLPGGAKLEPCESQMFKSSIFLENSLTGIEWVGLQGKALWEKIVFLSPPSSEGFDDIELRHGHSTLVFPCPAKLKTRPLVKEVIVHNDGDIAVTIVDVFFTPKFWTRHIVDDMNASKSCELHNFRILGCSDSVGKEAFYLAPGQNRSLFIEFVPTNRKERAMIMLNLRTSSLRGPQHDTGKIKLQATRSSKTRRDMTDDATWSTKSLAIGYDTRDLSCSIGQFQDTHFTDYTDISSTLLNDELNSRVSFDVAVDCGLFSGFTKSFVLFCAFAMCLSVLGRRVCLLREYSTGYRSKLIGCGASKRIGQNWRSAFRCLARIDPTSSDLQSIGREQTRHMVVARLKMMGAMQPQCFSTTGIFKRERIGAAGSSGRQIHTSAAIGSGRYHVNERIRMSDSIFGKFNSSCMINSGLVPVQLGWRSAAARGLIDSSSLETFPIKLRTMNLLYRRAQPIPARIQAVTGRNYLDGDDSTASSELGSSLGDLSDEESLPRVPLADNQIIEESASSLSFEKPTQNPDYNDVANQSQGLSFADSNASDSHHAFDHVEENRTLSVSAPVVSSVEAAKGSVAMKGEIVDGRENNRPLQLSGTGARDNATPPSNPPSIDSPSLHRPKQRISKKEKSADAPVVNVPSNGDSKPAASKTADVEKEELVEKTEQRKIQRESRRNSKSKSGKPSGRTKQSSHATTAESSASTRSPKATRPTPTTDHSSPSGHSPKAPPSVLRPPPGLLPPPGFQISAQNVSTDKDGGRSEAVAPTTLAPRSGWKVQPIVAKRDEKADDQESTVALGLGPQNPSDAAALSLHEQSLFPVVPPTAADTLMQSSPLFLSSHASSPPVSNQPQYQPDDLDHYVSSSSPQHPSDLPPVAETTMPPLSLSGRERLNSRQSSAIMDFDIMDFLDGILDEEGMEQSQNSQGDVGGGRFEHAEGFARSHPPPNQSPLANVVPYSPMNPWSVDTSEYNSSSRAAAYGISFDRNDIEHHDLYRHVMIATPTEAGIIPLLTPSAFLATDKNYILEDGDTNDESDGTSPNNLFGNDLPKK